MNQNKPIFDVKEPSIVRAQFTSKRDISFSSYLPPQNQQNPNKFDHNSQNKTEDSDQISIFDAAKYFSGLHDNQQQQQEQHDHCATDVDVIPARFSSVSSSVDTSSNYGGGGGRNSAYRTRSFHATPTASSEASWNSQTGLLANPPGSVGVRIIKSFSNNSSASRGSNNGGDNVSSARWPRMSAKWLIPRKKCPCSGKKSVQVEERIETKNNNVPRMVDLRQSVSSNGSTTTTTTSLYSPRQSSPKNFGTTMSVSTVTTLPVVTQESRKLDYNLMSRNPVGPGQSPVGFRDISNSFNNNNNDDNSHMEGGLSTLRANPKVVGSLRMYDDLARVNEGRLTSVITTTTTATASATVAATTASHGFTFPVLENQPIGMKKMFNNVISPNTRNSIDDPHRDSLEVFQPRSHPSPKSRRTSYEDENVSDGSSDLFEIESFSTTYPCRDSIDEVLAGTNFGSTRRIGMICTSYNNRNNNNNNVDETDIDDEPITPSVAPTECYAPSEVSVDWSVTTAEGFDRASLTSFSASASDFLYAAMRRETEKNGGGGGDGGGGGVGRGNVIKGGGNNNNNRNGNNGGLLGCRSEKVVSVGPSPIKCSGQEGPTIPAKHVSGRSQGGAAHVNGCDNGKSSLVVGRSRSSHLPMPFAT